MSWLLQNRRRVTRIELAELKGDPDDVFNCIRKSPAPPATANKMSWKLPASSLRHVQAQADRNRLTNINFSIRRGEVLGICRSGGQWPIQELLQAILHPREIRNCRSEGHVKVMGEEVTRWSARRYSGSRSRADSGRSPSGTVYFCSVHWRRIFYWDFSEQLFLVALVF